MNTFIKLIEDEDDLEEFMELVYEISPDSEVELEEDDLVFLIYSDEEPSGYIHFGEKTEFYEIKGFELKNNLKKDGIDRALLMESMEQLYGKPIHVRVNSLHPAVEFYYDCGFFLENFGGNCILTKKELN